MVASNLRKRILTAAILIPAVVLFIWLDRIFLPLFTLVFVTFAGMEYLHFWHLKEIYPHRLVLLLSVCIIIFLVYFGIPLLVPISILFLFVCLTSIIRFPGIYRTQNFLTETSASVFGIVYLSVLPVTIVLLRKAGFVICLVPLIITWLYDTFAYFVGSLIGKHYLAPKLSPKKTWEGTLLALPLTFPFTLVLSRFFLPDLDTFDTIVITVGIAVLATLGDLFESGMKRDVGLKDASGAFPGHGGFLDRIDSLIFSVPFFYLYLMAFV